MLSQRHPRERHLQEFLLRYWPSAHDVYDHVRRPLFEEARIVVLPTYLSHVGPKSRNVECRVCYNDVVIRSILLPLALCLAVPETDAKFFVGNMNYVSVGKLQYLVDAGCRLPAQP